MFKHLLIAIDGSELSNKALGQGLSLARELGAKVTVVTVTEPMPSFVASEVSVAFPIEQYDKTAAESASRILASAVEMARKSDVPCEAVHVKDRQPADGIIETKKKLSCDLIVMASHGRRGVSRMLLGSQANRVMVQSNVPVLICR